MTAMCGVYFREILSQKRDFREKPNEIRTNCDIQFTGCTNVAFFILANAPW